MHHRYVLSATRVAVYPAVVRVVCQKLAGACENLLAIALKVWSDLTSTSLLYMSVQVECVVCRVDHPFDRGKSIESDVNVACLGCATNRLAVVHVRQYTLHLTDIYYLVG